MNNDKTENRMMRIEPLGPGNWEQVSSLLQTGDLTRRSLLYSIDFNLTFNAGGLERIIKEPGTEQTNKLYHMIDSDDSPYGLIGITDIDWVQRRGTIVLLMGQADVREKRSYGPLKLLLGKAFREWDLHRVMIPVFQSETETATVLKGFGFRQEGILREHVFFKGETFDVCVYGILKNELHYVEV